jgi:hypothetical protein
MIVTEHCIAGADEPEIVQCLDDGGARNMSGAIDRGRHHGKNIVKVRHFDPVVTNKPLDRVR